MNQLDQRHCSILRAALDCYGSLRVSLAGKMGDKLKFEANYQGYDHFHFDVSLHEYTPDFRARLEKATGPRDDLDDILQ